MFPLSAFAVTANGERLSCVGFSLGETIHFGSLEFIADRFGGLSLSPNCSSFHLRVFLGLSNPWGQRQTSTLSILRDNFGERKAKFNLGTSRISQM
jgi:hypothetical protein